MGWTTIRHFGGLSPNVKKYFTKYQHQVRIFTYIINAPNIRIFLYSIVCAQHRLIRRDRLAKHCVFIREVTKIPVLFCFAVRSFLLKIIGGVFKDYSIQNKEYSLTKPTRQALQRTILSPAAVALHK